MMGVEGKPRLPVSLVTGFLGSGKSTFLRHLIRQEWFPRERTALLINDAGPLNMDARLFRGMAKEIEALSGGCACCEVSSEMSEVLQRFACDPKIDQVWIEASGVALTGDLVDRLTDYPVSEKTELIRVIHVVDAENFPGWFTDHFLQSGHVQWADLAILNKIDRVNAKVLTRIRKDLKEWNPKIPVLEAVRGEVTLPEIEATSREGVEFREVRHRARHLTRWVDLPREVDREKFMEWLHALPVEVYRAKGFVRFHDGSHDFFLQKVGTWVEVTPWRQSVEKYGLVLISPEWDEIGEIRYQVGC